jgi:DNA-binding transcriptional ArsR family regulator
MHAFDILGDPVRRRILQLLGNGTQTSGAIVEVIAREFGISQPAISQHLRVLRENGFATVEVQAQRRLYSIDTAPLVEVEEWLAPFRRFWDHKMDALATEIARGKKAQQERASESGAISKEAG